MKRPDQFGSCQFMRFLVAPFEFKSLKQCKILHIVLTEFHFSNRVHEDASFVQAISRLFCPRKN